MAVTVVAILFKPNAQETVICNKLTMKQPNPTEYPSLKEYAAELTELENSPPTAIELHPLAAIAIISHIQLAIRHPSVAGKDGLTQIAIDVARQLQDLFNPESTTYKVLELGWKPEENIPFAQEPKIEPFKGFCEEPCENFTRNLGCRCTGYQIAELADGEKDLPPEVLATGAAIFEKVKKLFEAEGFEVID